MLDRIPDAEVRVLGDLGALDSRGTAPVVRGVIDAVMLPFHTSMRPCSMVNLMGLRGRTRVPGNPKMSLSKVLRKLGPVSIDEKSGLYWPDRINPPILGPEGGRISEAAG